MAVGWLHVVWGLFFILFLSLASLFGCTDILYFTYLHIDNSLFDLSSFLAFSEIIFIYFQIKKKYIVRNNLSASFLVAFIYVRFIRVSRLPLAPVIYDVLFLYSVVVVVCCSRL